uniref:Uncharacterized protein n=1 Tax=Anopheles atroparvus TaxID=41427 RepID=A0A182J141_ANOAO
MFRRPGTAFAAALQVRNNKAAQNILEGLPNATDQIDQRERNFLHLAAASEKEMFIRNLILAGARLNDRDATQKTALHVAAERGTVAAVSALLQNGADFDAVDGDGNKSLHIAVREGHISVVRELLTEFEGQHVRRHPGACQSIRSPIWTCVVGSVKATNRA